jgi:transposase
MRFVPIKTTEQQAVLCLHRVRQGFIEERTATINRLRGLLAEFGVVLAQSTAAVVLFEIRKAIDRLQEHFVNLLGLGSQITPQFSVGAELCDLALYP